MTKWINLLLLILVIGLGACNKHDDPNAQLNKEIKAIDEYLYGSSDYIAYDSYGTRIVIDEFGNDAPPYPGQQVVVNYTASLFPSGTVFDAGTIQDDVNNISGVGLKRGISALLKGSHARLYIPSDYAFGKQGTSLVPPNTTVVYDVYLQDVIRTSAQQQQFEIDTAKIHDFIKDPVNQITGAIQHPSGIWYKINSAGTGLSPKPYDAATFDYKGTIMSNGSVFDSGTVTSQNIFNFVDGFKVGLPLMNEGGAATFYIPSGLSYGPEPKITAIPANANLIFEVKLNSILR